MRPIVQLKFRSSALHRNVLFGILTGLGLILSGCGGGSQRSLQAGDPAPSFTLPAAQGGNVSLAELADKQAVLLYFHMAAG